MMMMQEERGHLRYQEVVEFINGNKRIPSKHRIKEHDLLNWIKHNRKVMNAGGMKQERIDLFNELLDMAEEHKRKNQYV